MEIIINGNILKGVISGKKSGLYEKIVLQRIVTKENKEIVQFSQYTTKQVFHKNLSNEESINEIKEFLENQFSNAEISTEEYIYYFRVTSKGHLLTNKKKTQQNFVKVEQNKVKNYLLPEGLIVPPLIDLGVMNSDGYVVKTYYDKYKQINRFLEIINDCLKEEKKLSIVDFGCGKSYLTFILYYFLRIVKKIDCDITGIDLKEDVVNNCNAIAEKYQYNHLHFYSGDIKNFTKENKVDMIITLHACDIATDYALFYAIKMKCKYIFTVPCCQKEINQTIGSDSLPIITKYGILKERFSAILTDAIRTNLLEYYGYKSQIMEFVDIDNSPKNLLIRAVKMSNTLNPKALVLVEDTLNSFKINQMLYSLLFPDK